MSLHLWYCSSLSAIVGVRLTDADAIPKKRGPKSDVLEALLKRVDGLEKRLQDEKKPLSPAEDERDAGQDMNLPNDFNTPNPPSRPARIETDLYSPQEPR